MQQSQGVCLIDGHNVMHRVPSLSSLLTADKGEEARDLLAEACLRFALRRRMRVVLVFDGSATVRAPAPLRKTQLEIVFATGPGKADAWIVSRASELGRRKQSLWVVTEDQGIRRALPRGVRVLSAKDFWSTINPAGDATPDEKPAPPLEDVERFFLEAEPRLRKELETRTKKKRGAD